MLCYSWQVFKLYTLFFLMIKQKQRCPHAFLRVLHLMFYVCLCSRSWGFLCFLLPGLLLERWASYEVPSVEVCFFPITIPLRVPGITRRWKQPVVATVKFRLALFSATEDRKCFSLWYHLRVFFCIACTVTDIYFFSRVQIRAIMAYMINPVARFVQIHPTAFLNAVTTRYRPVE